MIEIKKRAQGSMYTLSNENGTKLTLCSFGAGVRRFVCHDKDIIVAPKDDDAYLRENFLFGKCVGPFLGRIDRGEVGEYNLGIDMEGYSLHSGELNFAFREFIATPDPDGLGIAFHLLAEEVPGKMPSIEVKVEYRLLPYGYHAKVKAIPSKPYPLNIAFHPYFNLGADKEGILEHILRLKAQKTVLYDPRMVPIGHRDIISALDFSSPKPLGRDMLNKEIAIPPFGGYDHCFIGVEYPVTLEAGNLRMTLRASRDCMQVYSLNTEELETKLLNDEPIRQHAGVALEAVNDPMAMLNERYDATRPYESEETIEIERI